MRRREFIILLRGTAAACKGGNAIATLIKMLVAVVAGAALATSALAQSPTSADQIEHHVAKIDSTRFHYLTVGTGDPVLLILGWPESWIAWRKVVPLLVRAGRRVVVLDPRGIGESEKTAGGYDLDTAARDLHGFLEATKLATPGGIDIVAHDIGSWIAHAHAHGARGGGPEGKAEWQLPARRQDEGNDRDLEAHKITALTSVAAQIRLEPHFTGRKSLM